MGLIDSHGRNRKTSTNAEVAVARFWLKARPEACHNCPAVRTNPPGIGEVTRIGGAPSGIPYSERIVATASVPAPLPATCPA